MDIRTLIFALGLLNLTLALVVFVYQRTSRNQHPLLRLWLLAKLCCGAGYLIGWARPLLAPDLVPWAHFGNLMQVGGMAMEFVAYARFLGAVQWASRLRVATTVGLVMYLSAISLSGSRHVSIVFGSGLAGLLYLGMSWLYLNRALQSPNLLRLMAFMNSLLAGLLLIRASHGLTGNQMVPYDDTLLNILMYLVGLGVTGVNGFGFLMLVQQQSDRALQLALHQLSQGEHEQRELLRTVAHEFRTPAAMVKASVDSLALIDKDLPPEVVRRHDNIRLAVQRMTNLAGALITRDRLTEGNLQPQHQTVSIDNLITETARHYVQEVPLNLSLKAPMAVVNGDPALLRIALQNLIDNALVHSTPEGTVDISTEVDNTCCRLKVRDQGPGVPKEWQADLFTGRYSGSGSLTKGVGLRIVKAIAEAHGGKVELMQSGAAGSVFCLTLPLQSIRSAAQA